MLYYIHQTPIPLGGLEGGSGFSKLHTRDTDSVTMREPHIWNRAAQRNPSPSSVQTIPLGILLLQQSHTLIMRFNVPGGLCILSLDTQPDTSVASWPFWCTPSAPATSSLKDSDQETPGVLMPAQTWTWMFCSRRKKNTSSKLTWSCAWPFSSFSLQQKQWSDCCWTVCTFVHRTSSKARSVFTRAQSMHLLLSCRIGSMKYCRRSSPTMTGNEGGYEQICCSHVRLTDREQLVGSGLVLAHLLINDGLYLFCNLGPSSWTRKSC